jgi:hypothetical protein
MSCCGRLRANVTGVMPDRTEWLRMRPQRHDDVALEYIGRTGLTVRGPATGTVYRFKRTGSKVLVRARDSAALAALAQLRRSPA